VDSLDKLREMALVGCHSDEDIALVDKVIDEIRKLEELNGG
jgi:hypothetical protein